ncbi:MAG: O-antigen ligase family protein [Bacteroidales bacterium]|nr:O-antigen ligase family protein [Bacteroidales bacterium]
MTKNSTPSIWRYIKNTHFFVFLFVFAELTKVAGFIPHIPDVVTYGIMALFALYCIFNTQKYELIYIALLAYIPLEILYASPDNMFSPWIRYLLFALIIVTCTGLCASKKLVLMRARIFEITCFCCAVLGVGSFFAFFWGINYMLNSSIISDFNIVGLFGGLTPHSMLLGPVAGVGTLYIANNALRQKKWILWALAALSLLSVLLSDSRSAFLSTISGALVLLQLSSNNLGKFFKRIIVIFILFACTLPLWQDSASGLIEKQAGNISAGSMFHTREDKWAQRIEEFKSSPIFGYGFASVDKANKDNSVGMNGKSIESGSSWLSVLSMTGIIGFLIIMLIYSKSVISAYKFGKDPLLISILTLLSVNMFTEGYIFFGGSFLAFLFWITIGVCSDKKYGLTR